MDVNKNSASLSAKAKVRVPFGTVSITEESKRLINEAIDSNWVTRGKYVQEFEERFAALFGVKFAVSVSSGTDADALSCAVLYDYGAQRGDEIIVPALTFVATGNAVFQAGFMPVFVDVNRETLNIDPTKIEEAITPKTRAIMPVHLMGKPADMDAIMAIAKKHNLYVIEDAAEAHGAQYKGRMVGSIGNMAAYSLYAAHIVTSIEGGMVITDDENMAEALRSLRNHGIVNKFEFKRIGFSAKMNELEAAVGVGNIKIFDQILDKRRRNLLYLINKFEAFQDTFITLKEETYEKIGPHAFSIIVRENAGFTKDEFVSHIESKGIDSRNLFYSIPTQCPNYAFMGKKIGDYPEAEYCSDNGTHIGIHQHLELEQLDYVVEVVKGFLTARK
ncbi:MAG: DegT/DnrJ/EryC1/StrS family aminotransferase [Candidatus Omnitrophica bacterium]|nr:DegT/DnrJ/EryC1/StrS family aminotransferase [Candidatus Omnitrophota bacterium]MBU1997472.1 DegT/DnrJ/EryC1/StrS family aminotransferase [Candidatus Omnitrophota bacterium]MBU4333045.1 DegT/DnrJ/EryC1/StrS family aminotransferase [Candidatus Omnitrophota bacterium]